MHPTNVLRAVFLPDGRRAVSRTGTTATRVDSEQRQAGIYVWDVGPDGSEPIPGWLPELAQAIAGRYLDDRNVIQPIINRSAVLSEVAEKTSADSSSAYGRMAKWFLTAIANRTISPFSGVDFQTFVQRRLEDRDALGLRWAAEVQPDTAAVLAALAASELMDYRGYGYRVHADRSSRRAIELAPDDLSVRNDRYAVCDSMRIPYSECPRGMVLRIDEVNDGEAKRVGVLVGDVLWGYDDWKYLDVVSNPPEFTKGFDSVHAAVTQFGERVRRPGSRSRTLALLRDRSLLKFAVAPGVLGIRFGGTSVPMAFFKEVQPSRSR